MISLVKTRPTQAFESCRLVSMLDGLLEMRDIKRMKRNDQRNGSCHGVVSNYGRPKGLKAGYTASGAPKHLYKWVNEKSQWTDGRTDGPSYRGASSDLKVIIHRIVQLD